MHQGFVRLRPEDNPESRRNDLLEMKKRLQKLGMLLGVTSEGENPIHWKKGEKKVYSFYLTTQSIIHPFLKELAQPTAEEYIVVLPGGRAGLMEEKIHHDLHLAESAAQIHFLKFRHLKELSALTKLTQVKWVDQLDKDPLQWSSPRQISMLDFFAEKDSDD